MNGDAIKGKGRLLDTNIIIGLLKDHPPALDLLNSSEQDAVFAYSTVTRMELLGFPGLTEEETGAIEALLSEMQYMPLNKAIEDRTIALRQTHRIKLPDAIIAATALESGHQLMTLDQTLVSVFARAQGQ